MISIWVALSAFILLISLSSRPFFCSHSHWLWFWEFNSLYRFQCHYNCGFWDVLFRKPVFHLFCSWFFLECPSKTWLIRKEARILGDESTWKLGLLGSDGKQMLFDCYSSEAVYEIIWCSCSVSISSRLENLMLKLQRKIWPWKRHQEPSRSKTGFNGLLIPHEASLPQQIRKGGVSQSQVCKASSHFEAQSHPWVPVSLWGILGTGSKLPFGVWMLPALNKWIFGLGEPLKSLWLGWCWDERKVMGH